MIVESICDTKTRVPDDVYGDLPNMVISAILDPFCESYMYSQTHKQCILNNQKPQQCKYSKFRMLVDGHDVTKATKAS